MSTKGVRLRHNLRSVRHSGRNVFTGRASIAFGEIQIVHFRRDRPEIFKDCLVKNRTDLKSGFRYDILASMRDFLQEHGKKDAIVYLCQYHHGKLDHEINAIGRRKALSKFKKELLTITLSGSYTLFI